MAKGLIVTRISAAAAISICWLVFNPKLAHAQPDQSESKCFPWQKLRDGNCVAKATPALHHVPESGVSGLVPLAPAIKAGPSAHGLRAIACS
jgi:hypothetical protein